MKTGIIFSFSLIVDEKRAKKRNRDLLSTLVLVRRPLKIVDPECAFKNR